MAGSKDRESKTKLLSQKGMTGEKKWHRDSKCKLSLLTSLARCVLQSCYPVLEGAGVHGPQELAPSHWFGLGFRCGRALVSLLRAPKCACAVWAGGPGSGPAPVPFGPVAHVWLRLLVFPRGGRDLELDWYQGPFRYRFELGCKGPF